MALFRENTTQGSTQGVGAAPGSSPKPGKKLSALKQLGYKKLAAMTKEELEALGSNSGDIAFVNLIGNTFNRVSRKSGDKAALGSESVGLILKNVSEQPIEYVNFPQLSKKVMDVDYSKPSKAVAQPGEEFNVNWVEAGYLITREQYAGKFTGDPERVITYAPVSPKEPGKLPTTKFNLAGGSIADHVVEIADEEGLKTRTVKPEFAAKFSIFAEATAAKPSRSPKAKKKDTNLSALAAATAFDAIVGDLDI